MINQLKQLKLEKKKYSKLMKKYGIMKLPILRAEKLIISITAEDNWKKNDMRILKSYLTFYMKYIFYLLDTMIEIE